MCLDDFMKASIDFLFDIKTTGNRKINDCSNGMSLFIAYNLKKYF